MTIPPALLRPVVHDDGVIEVERIPVIRPVRVRAVPPVRTCVVDGCEAVLNGTRSRRYCPAHRVIPRSRKNGRHGASGTPEYLAWADIRRWCANSGHPAWPRYGGRGVRVCARYQDSFLAFLADLGPRPEGRSISGKRSSYVLGRLDNDSPYSCGDCTECREKGWSANLRWATMAKQRASQRQPAPRPRKPRPEVWVVGDGITGVTALGYRELTTGGVTTSGMQGRNGKTGRFVSASVA